MIGAAKPSRKDPHDDVDELPKSKAEMTDEFIEFMNGFWDQYDTDGNGSLDKEEFSSFLRDTYLSGDNNSARREQMEAKFDSLFTEFDKDKNGVITKSEMFEFIADMFGVDAGDIDTERIKASFNKQKSLKEDKTVQLIEVLKQKDEEMEEYRRESDEEVAQLKARIQELEGKLKSKQEVH